MKKIRITEKEIFSLLKNLNDRERQPQGQRWEGLTELQRAEIRKIPKRRFVRRMYQAACVSLFVIGLSGIVLLQKNVTKPIMVKSAAQEQYAWEPELKNGEDIFEEETDTISSDETATEEEISTSVSLDEKIADIESQLNWIAQPTWSRS